MARKNKTENEAQTKIYEKYVSYMKKAKKLYIEGAVIDAVKYECIAEAYFEGASDMLKELDPKKSISKDAWKISL